MKNNPIKFLLNLFFKGLLLVAPIFLSGYVVYWAIRNVDGLVNIGIPGVGILIVIIGITFVGYLVNTFITQPIYDYFSRLLNKVPLVKLIYGSIKDLMEAFVGEDKKFNQPVIVEIEGGMQKIGFLTQKSMENLNLPEYVGVYFPFSYAFTGNFVLVLREKVKPLNVNSAEVMKYVVSGGISDIFQK